MLGSSAGMRFFISWIRFWTICISIPNRCNFCPSLANSITGSSIPETHSWLTVSSHWSSSDRKAMTALRAFFRGLRTGNCKSISHRWTVLVPRPKYVAISFHEFRISECCCILPFPPWDFIVKCGVLKQMLLPAHRLRIYHWNRWKLKGLRGLLLPGTCLDPWAGFPFRMGELSTGL